jgi:nucleotide-binding universal stress UspA family protein
MKILLAIDGSRSSEAAVEAVIRQALPQDTDVRVLHVVEPPSLMVSREMRAHDPNFKQLWQETRQQAEAMVKKTAESLRAKGFGVSTAVERGDAKSQIIDVAAKWHADLIVLGSHGRRGLERFLMGSVAEGVARYAPCSVQIVRSAKRH